MPRPTNKTELQTASKDNFEKLMDLVNSFPVEEQQERAFPQGTLNRNIKDVLAHLHHWHIMFLEWYEIGMQGEKPAMPAEGYKWKDLPELNKEIQEEYAEDDLFEIKLILQVSYNEVQELIEKHTDEELFEKKRYKWTGTTSLGAYLISNTSSHYDWARKLIKKQTKEWKKS